MKKTWEEIQQRRNAILASFQEVGARETAKRFGISRNAVYLTLDAIRFGTRKKPAYLKKTRQPKN